MTDDSIHARHKTLISCIYNVMHDSEFFSGELLAKTAGLAIKDPGAPELLAAIKALILTPTILRVGKLLDRCHRQAREGKYVLERIKNAHTKTWKYVVALSADVTPEAQLRFAELNRDELAELAASPPYVHMSAAEMGRSAVSRNPDAVVRRAQRRVDKDVKEAEREVFKAQVKAEPELKAAIKDIRPSRAESVRVDPDGKLRREFHSQKPRSDEVPPEVRHGIWERYLDGSYRKIGDRWEAGALAKGYPAGNMQDAMAQTAMLAGAARALRAPRTVADILADPRTFWDAIHDIK